MGSNRGQNVWFVVSSIVSSFRWVISLHPFTRFVAPFSRFVVSFHHFVSPETTQWRNWQNETTKWRNDETKQQNDETKWWNEITKHTANNESNILSTIWHHTYYWDYYYRFSENSSCPPSSVHSVWSGWKIELTSFVSFYSASPRKTATQREHFAPFLSNRVINNFSSFLFLPFFLSFPVFN